MCWATQTTTWWITIGRHAAITIWRATLFTTSLTDRKISASKIRETTSSLLTSLWRHRPLEHPTKTPTSSRIRMRTTALSRPLLKALIGVLTCVKATHLPAKPLVAPRTTELKGVSRTHLKVAFSATLSLRTRADSVWVEPARALQIFSVKIGPITNAAITTSWFKLLKKLPDLSAL